MQNKKQQTAFVAALELAGREGYLNTAYPLTNDMRDLYLAWCRKRSLPLAVLQRGPVYARIRIDLEPCGRLLESTAAEAFRAYLNTNLDTGWHGMGGVYDFEWERIPVAAAERIAKDLLRIAMQYSEPDPLRHVQSNRRI